jgi:hypothetical protein
MHNKGQAGKKTRVQFSKPMGDLLGVSESEIYEPTVSFPNTNFYEMTEVIHIITDIIQPQVFGSQCIPILKTFANPTNSESNLSRLTSLYFTPVTYVPLSVKEISQIRVRAVNELLQTLTFHKSHGLICTIHIRPQ